MQTILAKSRILIVDDFSDFRLSVKYMLQQLGAHNIDQASNAKEALKHCTDNNYHIILCDYNLGEGQDGQQILEELHERFLMLSGTLFLMVTAETSAAKVISAIEYQPDAYLTKPFTRDQLSQRLKRLMVKNAALNNIYLAINNHQPRKALELCEQVLENYPKVKFACMRIQTELFEKLDQLESALAVCKKVISQQPLLWALVGVGRLYFKQNKIQQSLQHFLEMKQNFPQQVSVLDWIAKCQRALGETQKAETTTQEALKISPKSVRRQTELGEVAEKLGHYDIALKAYSKAINEGSYSCLLKPQHFQHFYDNTRELVQHRQGREKLRLLENTESVFKKMERKLQKDPAAMAANLSAISRVFSAVDENEKTAKYLTRLTRTLEKPGCNLSAEDTQMIEKNLSHLNQNKATERSLKQLSARMNIKKKEQQEKPKEEQVSAEVAQAQSINSEGMEFVKQNRPLEALAKFRQSIAIFPDNNSYLLNAAQVIIESDLLLSDQAILNEAENYLREVSLPTGDSRLNRYNKLQKCI